jgi:hypothetical protein
MRDALVLAALLLSFATLLTAHLAIAVRLAWSVRPRWRALLALFVLPLAPIWARDQGWRALWWTWVGALTGYALARLVAAA